MQRDLYAVLGLDSNMKTNITFSNIKQAYRKKALETHPDQHLDDIENATEKFKEVKNAYDILSNPAKRQQYDYPVNAFDFLPSFGGETASTKTAKDAEQASIEKRYSELSGRRAFFSKLLGSFITLLYIPYYIITSTLASVLLPLAIPFVMAISPLQRWYFLKRHNRDLNKEPITTAEEVLFALIAIIGPIVFPALVVLTALFTPWLYFKKFCLLADLFLEKLTSTKTAEQPGSNPTLLRLMQYLPPEDRAEEQPEKRADAVPVAFITHSASPVPQPVVVPHASLSLGG